MKALLDFAVIILPNEDSQITFSLRHPVGDFWEPGLLSISGDCLMSVRQQIGSQCA